MYDQLDWVLYIEINSCVWGGPHTCGHMCGSSGGGEGVRTPGKSQVIWDSIENSISTPLERV